MTILGIDPSGNYNEGKGITGLCLFRDNTLIKAWQIDSKEYSSQLLYWSAVINTISKIDIVVCEDYRLYGHKADAQINSNLETPQLIGVIKFICFIKKKQIILQMAHEVKNRWSDQVLLNSGIAVKRGNSLYIGDVKLQHHSKDAVRHVLHYLAKQNKKQIPKIELEGRSNY